jgi:superoxide dismutase, Fe-Mn family
MSFSLPQLPYAMDALQPHISKETLEFHYGKHHNAYLTKLNAAVNGKPEESKSLEEVVRSASGGMFNCAAQVWNHTFYWHCMSPNGGGEPQGAMLDAINKSFGSCAAFKTQLSDKAATLFGSGWAWVVKEGDGIAIVETKDADTPVAHDQMPILTIDVWEHAYYIDYRNARPKYIEAFWNLINWEFVEQQLQGSQVFAAS